MDAAPEAEESAVLDGETEDADTPLAGDAAVVAPDDDLAWAAAADSIGLDSPFAPLLADEDDVVEDNGVVAEESVGADDGLGDALQSSQQSRDPGQFLGPPDGGVPENFLGVLASLREAHEAEVLALRRQNSGLRQQLQRVQRKVQRRSSAPRALGTTAKASAFAMPQAKSAPNALGVLADASLPRSKQPASVVAGSTPKALNAPKAAEIDDAATAALVGTKGATPKMQAAPRVDVSLDLACSSTEVENFWHYDPPNGIGISIRAAPSIVGERTAFSLEPGTQFIVS